MVISICIIHFIISVICYIMFKYGFLLDENVKIDYWTVGMRRITILFSIIPIFNILIIIIITPYIVCHYCDVYIKKTSNCITKWLTNERRAKW